jgi:hypothetical protein
MNDIPKPRPIVFMAAGYDLADALDILSKWESLSGAEVAALGLFGPVQSARDPSNGAHEAVILRPVFKTRRDPI